jgi:PIN domain nuclease of toxin-antitoxin system
VATVVVDTHALIWFLEGNERLSERARQALANPNAVLVIPAIVLAEAMWIIESGRTGIPSVESFLGDVLADPRVIIEPLTHQLAIAAHYLQAIPEMHDRQIVAAALAPEDGPLPLVTKDAAIAASGLMGVVW